MVHVHIARHQFPVCGHSKTKGCIIWTGTYRIYCYILCCVWRLLLVMGIQKADRRGEKWI